MKISWGLMRVFIFLNTAKLRLFSSGASGRFFPARHELIPVSTAISWYGGRRETAIGYEAGFAGVFQRPRK